MRQNILKWDIALIIQLSLDARTTMRTSRGWQDIEEKEVDNFLRALEREGIETRARHSSHRVQCRGLCFYAHGALYRVMRRQPRPDEATQWYFGDGTQFHRMDGSLYGLCCCYHYYH